MRRESFEDRLVKTGGGQMQQGYTMFYQDQYSIIKA